MINNGSIRNVMSSRMLGALGRSIGDLHETKVYVSTFIAEIPKTLGVLPIDIILGNTVSLSIFFVINSTAN